VRVHKGVSVPPSSHLMKGDGDATRHLCNAGGGEWSGGSRLGTGSTHGDDGGKDNKF
jgi:hypothetical protein